MNVQMNGQLTFRWLPRAETTQGQRDRGDRSHLVLGFFVFAGGRLIRYEEDMGDASDEMRIAAIWEEWLLIGPERQRVYMECAIRPVASVASAKVLAAHYRVRALFTKFHPMATYVPDKLQELCIAGQFQPMSRQPNLPSVRWGEMG